MSPVDDTDDAVEVSQLLEGAAKTIGRVSYCWLATDAKTGGANLRPMGRLLPDPEEDNWTIRFITDGRSRKASDIRRTAEVSVVFHHDESDAFVVVSGPATLREGATEVRQRWKAAYEVYFPTESDRANAAFVEVYVERMELWIRGITPEPFGLQPTILERDDGNAWRIGGFPQSVPSRSA